MAWSDKNGMKCDKDKNRMERDHFKNVVKYNINNAAGEMEYQVDWNTKWKELPTPNKITFSWNIKNI